MDTAVQNTICGMFENIVRKHPDLPAIIENSRTLTFRELSDLADAIGSTFPPDTKSVGIVMQHNAEMIAAMLAVLQRGARYVPAEPSFPRGRIRSMMREAEVQFILTEERFARRLSGFDLRYADAPAEEQRPAACGGCGSAAPDSPAYVLYTSGTTGRPKGIEVLNRNVCHYVRAFEHEFHIGPGDVMLQHSVCTFDIFVEEVFASLLNGAALAIPSGSEKEDIRSLVKFIDRHHVTILSGFPYLLADLNALPRIPSSLRLLISGGDVLRSAQVDRLVDQTEVYNTYGPSETTVCASYYKCRDGVILEDGTYPIGRPVRGTQIRILDTDGNETAPGETGEICILGNGVSAGYIGHHDDENKAFERLSDGRVQYRSGDMGYLLEDGNIAFVARKDSQVMIGGKRVEVLEVESLLYQCAGVEQAVVRSFEDEHKQPYIAAYIVPSEEDIRVSDIVRELSENLPSFMIPEYFVKMPEIPLNSNGKPDMDRIPAVLKAG